jgi:hypothetical protein
LAIGAFRVSQRGVDDVHFEVSPEFTGEIPEDQAKLRDEVERTLRVLRSLFKGRPEEFRSFFEPVLSLSQGGLVGAAAAPGIAHRALEQLRQEVLLREASKVKNGHLRALGRPALMVSMFCALAAGVTLLGGQNGIASATWGLAKPTTIACALLVLAGNAGGVWLSFGTRKIKFDFDDLGTPESDYLEPAIRLAFSGLLTFTFFLLLATKAVEIRLGALSSADIITSPAIALLIGILLGISEQVLPAKVTEHAASILK